MITIERLRELEKAATPGPWKFNTTGQFKKVLLGEKDAELVCAMRNALPALIEVAMALDYLTRSVEKLAFQMPAPNPFTPQFVQLCIGARAALERLEGEKDKP